MINRVVLVGRMTRDPELRKTNTGKSVVGFTLALNRVKKVEGQPSADFIQVVCWNKTADAVNQYCKKGSLVGVEGRLQSRSYDNPQGQKVYVVEVIADSVQFLESKSSSQQTNQSSEVADDVPNMQDMQDFESMGLDDDIQF